MSPGWAQKGTRSANGISYIFRSYKDRKRILVTGGSGFVGSHLVDKLMMDGHEVREREKVNVLSRERSSP